MTSLPATRNKPDCRDHDSGEGAIVSDPPPLLSIDPDGIPAELKPRRQWVGWRAEWNPERNRYNKIPLNPHTGRKADSTDHKTWGTFADALTLWQSGKADGIGFVFTESDDYCGIDLDHSRTPETGEIDPAAWSIVERLASYTEPSVSGTGIHVIVRGTLPEGCKNRIAGHEVYQSKRFFAFTGKPLAGRAEIHERTESLSIWHRETAKPKPTAHRSTTVIHTSADDAEIVERVRKTAKGARLLAGDWSGKPSASEGDMALANMFVGFGADHDQACRLLSIHHLVSDDKAAREDYIPRTVAKAIEDVTPFNRSTITANTRHTPQAAQPSIAGEIDPASCPVQLTEAYARITALERQLANMTAENERLRAENLMQKRIMAGQQRIRENADLKQTRPVAVALVNYFANRESAGAIPEDGMSQAPVMPIAEAAGCGEDAYRRQRDRLVGAGHLRYELRSVPIERIDSKTGEIITTLEKRQFIGMPEDCANVIDFTERLAQARIDGKQWGGQRTPCPACGEIAGQRVTRIVTCLGCGHETRTDETIDPTPQDADTEHERTTVIRGTGHPPRKMRVGGEIAPPVVNVSKVPHLAGRGVIEVDPLQAPLTAAFLAGESPHWSTDVRTG